jgi:hypothetical protein
MNMSEIEQSWQRYLATLEELRGQIQSSDQYLATPDQRPMAIHALLEAQAIAYNFAMAPDRAHPRIFRNTAWQTELYTMGGNGPDFDYRTTFIDGRHSYRLSGNVRDSRVILAQLSGALPGSGAGKIARNYDFEEFLLGNDGSFTIILSAERREGNWIELDPAAPYQWLLFRPTMDNWHSQPADIFIERIDGAVGDCRAQDFTAETVANRIDMAAAYIRYMVEEWAINFYQRTLKNAGGTNRFSELTTEIAGEVGSPTAQYFMGVFDLADDEALLVELPTRPEGAYWGFQVFDVWLRSLDFRTRQSALNEEQLLTDDDGHLRLVVSKRDPGVANWLDTAGLDRGQILLRNYRTPRKAEISARVVAFDAIDRELPPSVARVTPEQREIAIRERTDAYLRRHGE